MEERDIRRIVAEHPDSVREQCYQMFLYWERINPELYSYSTLGEALVNDEENRELFLRFAQKVEDHEFGEFEYVIS